MRFKWPTTTGCKQLRFFRVLGKHRVTHKKIRLLTRTWRRFKLCIRYYAFQICLLEEKEVEYSLSLSLTHTIHPGLPSEATKDVLILRIQRKFERYHNLSSSSNGLSIIDAGLNGYSICRYRLSNRDVDRSPIGYYIVDTGFLRCLIHLWTGFTRKTPVQVPTDVYPLSVWEIFKCRWPRFPVVSVCLTFLGWEESAI